MITLPNLITFARIPLAVMLLFIKPLSPMFYLVYCLCGISDIADGVAARKTGQQTDFGARLDSAADFVFFFIVIFRLAPVIMPSTKTLIIILLIAIIRLAAIITVKIKTGRFASAHTIANKITGLLLFIYPFSLYFSQSSLIAAFLLLIAGIASAEELAIAIISKEWTADQKSIFHV